ncbi:uncharacterized protein CCR75_006989 [Bremia lactucae]|uniref:Uncharacterized protein n=1 Tax=Bremia lactucae TaxID=4779 RepID=A0A976IJ24_BRELC|nr:hypothetical protein CCR75_006989 [Bremia lactucae]
MFVNPPPRLLFLHEFLGGTVPGAFPGSVSCAMPMVTQVVFSLLESNTFWFTILVPTGCIMGSGQS